MASATGIPDLSPREAGFGEDEPLIGRIGDASQQDGQPILWNLYLGTAVVAQGGIILLTALIWVSVFLAPLSLFSAHPLLNSAGVFFVVQAILLLQPTHTQNQKRVGAISHAAFNAVALSSLIAGGIIIEYNKFAHGAIHFSSAHGILGLITYIFLIIQALVGFTQYFTPSLYGGVDNAKSMYKWHRLSGYVILILMFATVIAATQTPTVQNMLKLKLWSILVCSALVLVGVLPRIKKQKFGLTGPKASGAFGQ